MTNRQMRHLCNELRRCFNKSEKFFKKVDFEGGNRRHQMISGYAVRTLDLLSGSISTLSKKEYVSVPTVTRACVEAFLLFVNLIVHENYESLIILHVKKERKRALENALIIEDIEQFADREVLSGYIDATQREIDDLAEHMGDYNELCASVKKRFYAAGMGQLYLSLYNLFCGESHSDFIAVEGGNLIGEAQEISFARRNTPTRDILLYVHVLLDLLVAIPVRLNAFLELGEDEEINSIVARIEEAKALYDLPEDHM